MKRPPPILISIRRATTQDAEGREMAERWLAIDDLRFNTGDDDVAAWGDTPQEALSRLLLLSE